MRIRKLELFGFKSFPDRTAFEFGSGVSCVVGPNGSGKSNVVDALRWCIGEQSARSLRGVDMADVIFAGSAERSPVGFAEVTLTLAADGGEPFPGDWARFEELEVGRRLYRDGTSEYLVNRVKCRRRDVVDLFLDTGVGSNLYSFIAQGQVDRIVSQSASERRNLIDEAAGISRYKARRDEALARLTATGAQLDRAADVADEMGRRLRVLEKQVIRAGQFRRSRARIRQREIALGVVKYGALAGDRRALREQLRRATDDTGALKRAISRQEGDVAERSAEVASVREAVATWRDQAAELEAQRREAEGARTLHQARHHELIEARDRATRRAGAAAAQGETARKDAEEARAEAEALEASADPDALAAARKARDAAREALREARDTLGAVRAREAAREERWRAAREEIARLEARLAELASGVEVVPDAGEAKAALELARTARESLREALDRAQGDALAAREEVRAAEADDLRGRAAADAAREAWDRARQGIERRRAELTAWAERTCAGLRRDAAARAERERTEAAARAETWTRALREAARVRRAADDAAHKQGMQQARLDADAADRALQGDEATRVAAARAAVDREPLHAASAQVSVCDAAIQAADSALTRARTVRAETSGRLAALEAEWRTLDARRRAEVPAEWADRPVLDGSDPRLVARPDLAALPVIGADDLGGARGRGVLAAGGVTWRVVEDRAALADAVRGGQVPVVARDGSARIDADGVVELGAQAEDRWAAVRAELEPARADAAAGKAREAEALAAVGIAQAAGKAAQAARFAAARAVEDAEARAVAAARDGVRAARQVAADRAAVARTRMDAERDARLASQDAALEQAIADVARARAQGIAQIRVRPAPETAVWGMAARAWPADPGQRPAAWIGGDLAVVRGRASAADGARASASAGWEASVRAEQVCARRLAELEQGIAEARARSEGRAAESAAVRARLQSVRTVLDGPTEVASAERAAQVASAAELALASAEDRAQQLDTAWVTARERARAARERAVAADGVHERAEVDRLAAVEESLASAAGAELALAEGAVNEARGEALATERAQVLERTTRDKDRLDRLQAELERTRAALDADRRKMLGTDSSRADLDRRVEAIQAEIEALRGRLGDRYQVSIPGLLDRILMRKELVIEPDEGVAAELRVADVVLEAVQPLSLGVPFLDDEDGVLAMVAELEAERSILAELGEVNLAAEAEYGDLAARWTELDTQRADLEESVRTIRGAIATTNRICRERFRDAYDRVNEAFQLSYPRLVGGGDARLALTDEEDLLETGVDIFVRPPGKRLQNLTLLSGGEKAMTAIALLLALFQVKPSPFCVLDEVDAPLDEANGGRFNDMVREMSRMSQFIVITHNRRTMECADVLYGVTMARPGVSTLVSVALERRI